MNSLKFQDRLLGLQDNLLNFAYMLTANREEAKDLLQDTTLKALDNEDKYIDNVNFKGWVFTIMRNIFINNYRRVVRNQTIIDQTEDLYHLNLPQDSGFASPEGSFTVKEITTAINSFSEEYRIPFSMHVAGYKYHEIAEKMDLPLGTVKSRIFFVFFFNPSVLRTPPLYFALQKHPAMLRNTAREEGVGVQHFGFTVYFHSFFFLRVLSLSAGRGLKCYF